MQALGPFSEWESFKTFNLLSEEAYGFFNKTTRENPHILCDNNYHLFQRFKYIAENFSYTIRMSTSWCLLLPALSLVRTRLEQTIVCSYLTYEDKKIGLEQYLNFHKIESYNTMQRATHDEQMKKNIASVINTKEAYESACHSPKNITPEYLEGDKFSKKWTTLNLESMSKKRDIFSQQKSKIHHQLEHDYRTMYVLLSSVVHSTPSLLIDDFISEFVYKEEIVLMPPPYWMKMAMICCTKYDIIQCYEILKFLSLDCDNFYMSLINEWEKEKDKIKI
ncbi:DUF5677 domain-containing protein [Oleidesulfovibrio sp.]|uniref:DUF5677 domain-containing protein n=1 Tax=Oleidesulfovibrio sp. TaxID=2909707 RepID=UPI003A8640C1